MRRSLFIAIIGLAALAGGVVPAAAQGASLTVTPNVRLTDGDVVTVTGTGLVNVVFPGVFQCSAAVGVDPSLDMVVAHCDPRNIVRLQPVIDAGNFSVPFTVHGNIVAGFDGSPQIPVDCTVASCVILAGGLASREGSFLAAVAPISFGSDIPTMTADCKGGGWRNLSDDHGQPFRSQGQCVRFVLLHD